MNFARLALLVAGIVAFEEMVSAEPVESNQLRGLKTIGVDEISYGTPGMMGLEMVHSFAVFDLGATYVNIHSTNLDRGEESLKGAVPNSRRLPRCE